MQRLIFRILFTVGIEPNLTFFKFHSCCTLQQRTRIVLIGILKFCYDSNVLCDQMPRGEDKFGGVVIYCIIEFLSAHQQFPIDVNPFCTRKNGDKGFVFCTTQAIWTLIGFNSLNDLSVEFSFGKRDAILGKPTVSFCRFPLKLRTDSLSTFFVAHEISSWLRQPKISCDELEMIVRQLNIHLIEFLKFIGVAICLNRNVGV